MEESGQTESLVRSMDLSGWNLSFRDADKESLFLDSYFWLNLSHLRLCLTLSVIFFTVYAYTDFLLARDSLRILLTIRFGIVVPAFLLVLILTYVRTDVYKRFWQGFNGFFVLLSGLSYIIITALGRSPYGHSMYVGVIFCLFFGYTFIRFRFVWATLSGLALTAAYIYNAFRIIEVPPPLLAIQIPILMGVNALGMLAAYHLEFSARQAFHLNSLLQDEKEHVGQMNRKLENTVRDRTAELRISNKNLAAKLEELKKSEQERSSLEKQLAQAQKMEAVGRLAGGVAHDFNNILQAIIGCIELARRTEDDVEQRKYIDEIGDGAMKAAALTRQLLAFSRQQVIELKKISLNDLIENFLRMIRRTIGEDIKVTLIPCEGPALVRADQGQVEQILLNLCVNARDAMPKGGVILIETAFHRLDEEYCGKNLEARAGEFIALSVSDTGCGMDQVTMSRIFEPFFTSKRQGRGTGLGLAMVYGIVKQHGGFIRVYSEPGKGSRFKVYLPAVNGQVTRLAASESLSEVGGTETIFLAEDNESVRRFAGKLLRNAGYNVITAGDGRESIELLEKKIADVDIAILDVVMPYCGGQEVYRAICRLRPDLPVLFSSGYSANAEQTDFAAAEGLELIQKPYKPSLLLKKIRDILDSSNTDR